VSGPARAPAGRTASRIADASLRTPDTAVTMSRVSARNQVTLPVSVLRAAGLSAGDAVVVRVAGPGRIEVERVDDLVARFAGSVPDGTYGPGHLDDLRGHWRR
jgi:bifunctional DNA-binding transcriptional regulator/antitoxin component of YhaV-PrlF toxin-antitoxin module